MTEPELGSGALREPVAFVIETEGGDLYDQGRVLFSDARQAQDRVDDLNAELEKESFLVAPLYRALSLSSPIEPDSSKMLRTQISKYCDECPDLQLAFAKDRLLAIALVWTAPTPQASSEIREAAEKLLPFIWESNFDEEVETAYERAVVALRDALAPSRQGAAKKS